LLPENELIECKGVTPGVFYFRLCIRISVCSDFINAIILERGWLLEYVLLGISVVIIKYENFRSVQLFSIFFDNKSIAFYIK
jgi:hypothetical protein